jgi:hypothetical protein
MVLPIQSAIAIGQFSPVEKINTDKRLLENVEKFK